MSTSGASPATLGQVNLPSSSHSISRRSFSLCHHCFS
ncbi:unnamed protein product [Gulo gulo]|uniref:Uncharacterized protein n=1 Tax=Gulo gulo TaxID=48420 RepID=A0A9X9QBA9_GULGU|nr:unnamed protein product [Gulo gulo]